MSVGPVSVLVVEFPGNKFRGQILPALKDLIDAGTIRVIDLVFVAKDVDGSIATITAADIDGDLSADLLAFDVADSAGLLGDDDLELVADSLAPGSSAAMLLWENSWAAPFATALASADARLIDLVHIPRDAVIETAAAAGITL